MDIMQKVAAYVFLAVLAIGAASTLAYGTRALAGLDTSAIVATNN
jgi:hypothetical protein